MFIFHNLISPSTTHKPIKSMENPDDQFEENTTLFDLEKLRTENTYLLSEIQLLQESNQNLVAKHREAEGKIESLQHELGMRESEELVKKFDVGSEEKEGFFEEIEGFELLWLIKESLIRVHEGLGFGEDELGIRVDLDHGCEEKKESSSELEESKGIERFFDELGFVSRIAKRVEEKLCDCGDKSDFSKVIEGDLKVIDLINESLIRINDGLNEESSSSSSIFEDLMESKSVSMKLDFTWKMLKRVDCKINECRETVKKAKRELEINVESLMAENRDINDLLRVALLEKEALEKSIDKLKGENEQKSRSAPLFQLAERSLQRVGFGFIMGGTGIEQQDEHKKDGDDQFVENSVSSSSVGLDICSESEEEVVSLAFAVENLMKNLRLEITRLRIALNESRSDCERLENITEKQAQKISELTVCIKELEDQREALTRNVEELLIEIRSTEEDVVRWREACELEVEAGKRAIQERDKVVAILMQELEKTRSALQVSNSKIKSKEEVAVTAMAAQSVAEKSLQLADSGAAELRQRIEMLTRRLEEVDSHEKKSKSKVISRLCWPWLAFKPSTARNTDYRPKFQNADVTQNLLQTV